MGEIRVLVVDDYVPIRNALRQLLERQHDMQVVGEAGDAQDAVKKTKELVPDVVLMDVSLPGRDIVYATHAIRSQFPQTRVIWLATVADDVYKSEAMKAGASACLAKVCRCVELLDAIRSMHTPDRRVRPCA